MGWGGGCTGSVSTFDVTVDADKSCDAQFDTVAVTTWDLTVTKSGTGTGTVTSSPAGIDCGGDCSGTYNDATLVSLTATADAGSEFVGWSGACTGSVSPFDVTMDADKSCDAQFSISSAQNQEVYPDPLVAEVAAGGTVSLDVMYDVSDADAALTGIGVRVHFDSSKLTFDQVHETLAFGRLFDPTLVVSEADSSDFDGDASTDQFVSLAWVDFGGSWPGSLPQKLAAVDFVAAGDFAGSTTVRFSASDLAAGYGFSPTPAHDGMTWGCLADP